MSFTSFKSVFIVYLTFYSLVSWGQFGTAYDLAIYEDKDTEYTYQDIKSVSFTEIDKRIFSLGMTQSTIWVKVTLDKSVFDDNELVVEIERPFLQEVELIYENTTGNTIRDTLGLNHKFSKNKLHHYTPSFEIDLNQVQGNNVYLKLSSNWAMLVPINIRTKDDFHNNRTLKFLFSGLFFGALLFIGFYNLFLYFSTRDFNYVLYFISLICSLLSQGYISGLLIYYLTPNSPEFNYRYPVVALCFASISSVVFIISFLDLKKVNKYIYWLLNAIILFAVSLIALELLHFDFLTRSLVSNLIILTCLFILVASIYSLVKGIKSALFLTIAWTIYLTGTITFAIKTLGYIPHNLFTEHFIHIGTLLEVLLLSFALGYKYKLITDEKERLERQTRKELEELVSIQTESLEKSLEEKELLLKEIHHRVKNNLQLVISILDLQLASIVDNKNKEALVQSKSRVYSMSLIHQSIYQSESLANINIKEYVEQLFNYIKENYTNKSVYHSLDIDDKVIPITKAVPLGLIMNELLTNSFKYGFSDDRININIRVKLESENLEMYVSDSGKGFDDKIIETNVKQSLGLFLVKALTKQLKGSLSRYYEDNMFFTKLQIPLKSNLV